MVAQHEKTLPQYVDSVDSKYPLNGLDAPPVGIEATRRERRRRRLRWVVVGTVLAYCAFKAVAFGTVHEWQNWKLTRPHRIPPKAAEQIFL